MPEAGDALASVGYLVAAGGITLAALFVYGLTLGSRLARARERFLEIRDRRPPH